MMDEDFPEELDKAFKTFEASMNTVEKNIKLLLHTERSRLVRGCDPLDTAKLDLVSMYAINSFYWSYLIMRGVDPKQHPIKQELDRIRTYMAKVEEIKNRKNAPKLAKDAAKRFIRNAMFDSKETDKKEPDDKIQQNEKDNQTSENESRKRKNKQNHKNKKRPKH